MINERYLADAFEGMPGGGESAAIILERVGGDPRLAQLEMEKLQFHGYGKDADEFTYQMRFELSKIIDRH